MKRSLFIVVLVLVLLAACTQHLRSLSPVSGPSSPTSSAAASTVPASGAQWSAWDPYSLPEKSQGSGSTTGGGTYAQVCPHVDPALESARPGYSDKEKVYAAYGITPYPPTGKYEMDHIIPIELGGAPNTPSNLFPELNTPPDTAMMHKWGLSSAYVENPKDILEDALHDLVCSGRVSLATAQQAISTDWVAAYHTYVEGMNP